MAKGSGCFLLSVDPGLDLSMKHMKRCEKETERRR